MAIKVDDVSVVTASKDTWNIVTKVIRLWVSPSFSGEKLPFSMELVLMDSKGCKIHASVRKTLVYRFKPLLTEGHVYQISYSRKITCVVLATIKFIPEWNPWWYPACKCNKKVIPADGMYFCENCVRHIVTPSPWYKLQVRVMDHTESTTFIIFDQEASTLLNRSCASFVKSVTKDPTEYPVPPEVLALIDKTFLFKIEVNNSSNSKFEPSYRVKKVCSDEDVITQFKSTLALPDGSNLYQVVSTSTSILRGESSSSTFYKNLDGDFGLAENSPNALTTNATTVDLGPISQISVALPAAEISNVESTPSKRPSPPYDEALDSSNVVKKPLKVIKKENI
ncbi:hypothetical protein OROGR_003425 [Orobanche gracilis]